MLCATLATVVLRGKPIIIAEFFAFLNITLGNNPDGTFSDENFTVGVAGMVNIAGFVFQGLAVNIIAVIEIKNVRVTLRPTLSTPSR